MKFQYIAEYRGTLTRSHLFRLMRVTERGLHARKHRPPSHRQRRDIALLAHIREQHRLSLGRYGQPRMSERPVLADDGTETGAFEIPARGRRFQALSLLVKQKRLAKITLIPCIVRDAGSAILAEDDSLAENMQRVALHPLDQFRAFVALRDKGQSDAEIAAAFFVTPQVVTQRLKRPSVAPENEGALKPLASRTFGGGVT